MLPNLLAARQTAAWIIGMWGGVTKKGCGLQLGLISAKCTTDFSHTPYFRGAYTVITCRLWRWRRICYVRRHFSRGRRACQDAQRIVQQYRACHATPRQVGFCHADIASKSMSARHKIKPSDRVTALSGSALQRAASILEAAALRPL